MKRVYRKNGEVVLRLLYSEARIAAEVSRIAAQINADFEGEELLLVVVLKGSFIFAADLVRKIRVPLTLDFVQISSYCGTATTGTVSLVRGGLDSLAGKNVLVVEDIVDTGLSLEFLMKDLSSREAKTLRSCVLVDKSGRRRTITTPYYSGITCRNKFLVGYGLDLDERYRELSAIYKVINNTDEEV